MKDPRFPELNTRQVKILKEFGEVEEYQERTQVLELGEKEHDFFLVLDGEVTIEDPYNNGAVIVTHKRYEFTGDNGMLSTRGAQFHGFARAGSRLIRIRPEKLKEAIATHSDISDILLNAFLLRQETVLTEIKGGIKLVGAGHSKETYEIRDFMEKNHIWHNFLDVDNSEEAVSLLENFNLCKDDLPILINSKGGICRNPTLEQVARESGVLTDFEDKIFDLLVIGAGPSGLAASVYAASEGLSVVTIDSKAPGGQAGKSSKIENYLGFPTGISGSDLANRAYVQAQKFGCNISIPHSARSIQHCGRYFTVCASNDKVIKTKAIMAATGAEYQQLPVDNVERYEGNGIYASATSMNVSSCKGEIVGIVGGGNSAGQAALFLADHAAEVHIILRGDDLGAKMSDYLVQRVEACDKITVQLNTEVKEFKGHSYLEACVLENKDGKRWEMPISNLFTFIGAKPCTDWLGGLVVTDHKGFICTGSAIPKEGLNTYEIYQQRKPQSLETSIPGFFAVGDVRKGSVKRVASAVGEGSMAVSQVHQFLAEINSEEPTAYVAQAE